MLPLLVFRMGRISLPAPEGLSTVGERRHPELTVSSGHDAKSRISTQGQSRRVFELSNTSTMGSSSLASTEAIRSRPVPASFSFLPPSRSLNREMTTANMHCPTANCPCLHWRLPPSGRFPVRHTRSGRHPALLSAPSPPRENGAIGPTRRPLVGLWTTEDINHVVFIVNVRSESVMRVRRKLSLSRRHSHGAHIQGPSTQG